MWVLFVTFRCTSQDRFEVHGTYESALTAYEHMLAENEHVYCAGIAPIHTATEPHWVQPKGA